MSRTLLLALASVGCREIILPADGGSGTSMVTVGGHGGSGAEGVGGAGGSPNGGGSGAGGSGAAAPLPLPVPGCEQLVSAGEPVEISVPIGSRHVRIAALGEGRAGLTYTQGLAPNGTLWSTTVEGAFDLWPPAMVAPAETQVVAQFDSYPGPLQSSIDGVFALNEGPRGFFSFDAPGVLRPFEQGWRQAFPRPQASDGALLVSADVYTDPHVLSSLPTMSSAPEPIAQFPDGCRSVRVVHEPGGGAFISRGGSCESEGAPGVDFYRLDGNQLNSLGGFELPFTPYKQFLTPREGGYFYAISNYEHGIVVYSLDPSGTVVQEPWTDTFTSGDIPTMFQRWRHGFVISRLNAGTIALIVSDGTNRTVSSPFDVEIYSSNSEVAMLVGGVNDSSIVFAYPQYLKTGGGGPTIGLFRADCLTFD